MRRRTVRRVKTVAKWILYFDSLLVLIAALNLYHVDAGRTRRQQWQGEWPSDQQRQAGLLLALNLVLVVEIHSHFLWPHNLIIWLLIGSTCFLLLYRSVVVAEFAPLHQLPHAISLVSGSVWLCCNIRLHQER